MSESGIPLGVIAGRGQAAQRYADALLRVLGGTSVTFRFADAASGDSASQLGLEPPPAEDIAFYPALIRKLAPAENGKRRIEVLLSSTSVRPAAQSHNIEDVGSWLLLAQVVVQPQTQYQVDTVICDHMSGSDYLYHVVATEQ